MYIQAKKLTRDICRILVKEKRELWIVRVQLAILYVVFQLYILSSIPIDTLILDHTL